MRIRGAKTELEEAGESTEGMAESTATMRQEIEALSGVDIMLNDTTFKSTYQVLDELSQKWEDLSDIAQASIIELMAGKHQGNVFSSLMENFDTARKALETSMNSEGSATTEHEKWMQSVEAGINKIKASWQALSQSFLKSDFLKGTLGALTKLIDGFAKLIDMFGTFPTLLTAFTAVKSISGKGFFKVIEDEATRSGHRITNTFKEVASQASSTLNSINLKTNSSFKDGLKSDIAALGHFRMEVKSGSTVTEALNNTMKNASDAAQEYAVSGRLATDGVNGFVKQQQQAEVSMLAQNKSLTNANALMKEYHSGCKTTGMTQRDFANAVKQTNPHLATAMTSTKSASAGMVRYTASMVGAKIATLGLQIATMALNMVITMGIGLLVSGLFNAISKVANAKKDLAERVDELTSKFKEQHNELKKLQGDYDTSNESSMISKYEKLSKGVDGLGRNVALTADEYSEYQSIVNQIAEQIPSLVVGYDEHGNAILSCKNNVEELTAAYEKLIHAQNREVLSKAREIEKDFANDIKEAESNSKGFLKGSKISTKAAKVYEDILNAEDTSKVIDKVYNENNRIKTGKQLQAQLEYGAELRESDIEALANSLEDNGFKRKGSWFNKESDIEYVKRAFKERKDIINDVLNDFYDSLEEKIEPMKTEAQAVLSEAFDVSVENGGLGYDNISEEMQKIAYQSVNSLDYDFFANLQEKGKTVTDWTKEMLEQLDSIKEEDNTKIEAAFELQTKFNGGEISYGEYVNSLKDVKSTINNLKLKDTAKNQLKISLGLDENGIVDQYDALRNRLVEVSTKDIRSQGHFSGASDAMKNAIKEAEEFLDEMTASEYAVAVDLIAKGKIDLSDFDIKSLRKYIEEEAKLHEALNFETSIEVDKTSLELLNTALTESASAMGLTEESIDSLKSKYSDLEGYNFDTLFEKTANGVKLNREELAKLERKYQQTTKSEVEKHLKTLAEEYNNVTAEIDKCTNASERAKLISKREGYKTQIDELAEYQAQLEGVTGAYQRWIDAQNTPEDYEGYQAIATSKEDIKDEISRGFLSNATKEYIDLLSGKNLQGGTIDDYATAWGKLDDKITGAGHSIMDFFTVNDDGDITAKGIDRFFKSLQTDFKGSVAKFDKETKKWDYDFGAENLKKIQDKWGIGIESIELLLEAAKSAGYDIDWGGILGDIDLDTSNFETLVSAAESAQESFNKLKGVKDVKFNFTASGIKEATDEVEKAREAYIDLITNKDGTINLKANGANDMRLMLSTLLIQKQQLEDSNIVMNVDTSQLDKSQEDIGKAINAVIQFREKYKNLEIAVSTGQGIDKAKTELDGAMKELQGLGDKGVDIAAKLMLGEDADGSTLSSKLDTAIKAVGKKDIKVGCKLDETAIGTLNSQVLENFNPKATVKITKIDEALVNQYTSTEKTANGTVKWKNDESLVVEFQDKTHKAKGIVDWANNAENVKKSFSANGTVNWTSGNKVKVKVISEANGTANANGTTGRAYARGSWGIKGSGTALGGELGQELVVRDGRFFTIGDNGAEFFKYKPNDIVFNAAQTESLFKYGGIKGAKPRGTMLATGSAFVGGSIPSTGRAFGYEFDAKGKETDYLLDRLKNNKTYGEDSKSKSKTTSSSKSKSSSSKKLSSSKSSSSDSAEEFKEVIDLIEIALKRVQREIDNLDQKASNVYKTWGSRNTALSQQIGKVRSEISLQQQAYNRYLKEANSVGLSSSWAKKVRNGEIDIETIRDEALKEKIDDYQNWYEKALDAKDAIEELKETEASLYRQRFDNVQTQYDAILQGYEHTESMLNEYISQAEEQGHIVSKKYYNALISNEKDNIAKLKQEQSALIKARDEAVASGSIKKQSEDWYNMCNEIDSVTQAIEESTTALLEFDNAIREIDWSVFDLIQERISDVSEEADFLIELMSNDKLFDDKGVLSEQGAATLGLHAQKYNDYMYQSDDYGNEVAKLDKQIAKDPYDQELINRRQELLEAQREQILAAEDCKNSIKSLLEDAYSQELDYLQEKIDKTNEAMDSQKD